jgi:hypothetical protein
MEAQLLDLYEQRLILEREIGTADTETIIRMFRSLTEQLEAIYVERDETRTAHTVVSNHDE